MIRVPRAQMTTVLNCRWCLANTDYNTDASQVHPRIVSAPAPDAPRVSRDDFGVNLFAVLFTISTLHTLRRQLNVAVHTNQARAIRELTARYHEAQGYLANQLPTLTDHEMAQVLERYPDVVTM